MKSIFSAATVLLLSSPAIFAQVEKSVTGLFFDVVSSGQHVIITTRVPQHPNPYPHAGIQILTPGYVFTDPTTECSSYNSVNGMCLFSVSNTDAKVISLRPNLQLARSPQPVRIKLCLDGTHQLTCQNYTYNPDQFAASQHAYVVSSGQNAAGQGYLSVCDLLNAGAAFGNCVMSSGQPANLNSPQAITFNAMGDMAYISNFGDGSVSNCAINPATGLLAACQKNATGIPTPSTPPPNPTRHSILGGVGVGNGYVYVPYFDNNSLQIWSLNADGSFKTMTSFMNPALFSGPNAVTVSPDGQWVYVANSKTPSGYLLSFYAVSFCKVNGGSLDTCGIYVSSNFNAPLSVSFNQAADKLYVANSNSTITVCDVALGNANPIGPCIDSGQSFNFGSIPEGPVSNIFMPSGLAYGYVPNAGLNTVSICPFLASGAFNSCIPQNSPAPAPFITPTGVALTPINAG